MAELRSFIFIDQMQPQTLCYMASWMRGRLPRTNMAAQIIEVAPGLDIEPLTDVALKYAEVGGGILVVERQFGYLEFHSRSTGLVKAAAQAVLESLDADESQAMKPQILASKIVTRVDPVHAFLINRNKLGSMILPGESLFVLEMQPASYAILAANEAEKHADIKIIDYRMIGATGRVYLSGEESSVRSAAAIAEEALQIALEAGRMIDKSLLRDLVKSVIAEEVAAIRKPKAASAPAAAAEERVAVASDADLIAFARRVLLARRRSGQGQGDRGRPLSVPAGRGPRNQRRTGAAPQPPAPAAQSHRIDSGVVTESTLNKLPRGLARLLLGPGVTVTPLAKDRARALGLTFERIKP